MNTSLFRYFKVSSSYAIFHAEIEKFRQIMTKNGYPEKFFDKIVHSFLNKIFEKVPTELIAPKRVVIFFHYHILACTLFKFGNKSLNYFPLPIRIFNYGVFFDGTKIVIFFSI